VLKHYLNAHRASLCLRVSRNQLASLDETKVAIQLLREEVRVFLKICPT